MSSRYHRIALRPRTGDGPGLPVLSPTGVNARAGSSLEAANADVATASEANVVGSAADPRTGPDIADAVIARRWHEAVELAVRHGVTAAEVTVRFTAEDIADLCAPEHDEAMIARCMRTLALDIRAEGGLAEHGVIAEGSTDPVSLGEGETDARAAAPPVRCGDCLHFRRRATHPRLGDCARGCTGTAPSGFWDTQRRGCTTFSAVPL